MSSLGHRILGAVLAVASVLAVAALTRAPYAATPDDEAGVRLSWRVRSEQVRACVPPTPEELEQLPPHMRNPDACVGDVPPFRLHVEVDGRTVLDRRIEAAGARGDRPIYVLRDIRVPPGPHHLTVDFEQISSAGSPEEGDEELLELDLDADLELAPREVVLVTLDPETRRLVVRR